MKPVNNPAPDLVSIDDLHASIVSLAARINAETYELLVLVRQFDERAGWLQWGLQGCAEWLHHHCDFSMSASREDENGEPLNIGRKTRTVPTHRWAGRTELRLQCQRHDR